MPCVQQESITIVSKSVERPPLQPRTLINDEPAAGRRSSVRFSGVGRDDANAIEQEMRKEPEAPRSSESRSRRSGSLGSRRTSYRLKSGQMVYDFSGIQEQMKS